LSGLPLRFSSESKIKMLTRLLTKSYPRSGYQQARPPGTGLFRFLLMAAALTNLGDHANGEAVHDGNQTNRISTPKESEAARELVDVVEAFIAAGETNDPAARGKYLAPKIFYYGHSRTREQAIKAIASLYRRWPERKFAPAESVDLFQIPNHQGVYRVTAVYAYKFDNPDEHLSGKAKLTCVVEHDGQGTRIIGVDEKLVSGSTEYHGP
jgi:hypothetical protein